MKITAYYECENKNLEVEVSSPDELFEFEYRMDELQAEADEEERAEAEEQLDKEREQAKREAEEIDKAVREAKSKLKAIIGDAAKSGVCPRKMAETITSAIREMRQEANDAQDTEA